MGKKRTKGSLGMQWFTTGVSTTLVLILLGIVSFFVLFARQLSDSVKENLAVTVLLRDDAGRADIEKLRTALKAERYVCGLDYISKERALQEQVKAMGSDPTEFLGANPFTASFELRVNAPYANSKSLDSITSALKKNPCVEDVMYQKDLVDTVNDNLRRVSYVLLGVAVLLALVSFALISNTVRLSIYSGRFVIRTMKLVGASWGFICRPFMARSFSLGFLSGIVADALLWGGIHAIWQYDPSISQHIHVDMLITVGIVVLLFGLLLTLGCTYVSVRRYLRMKAGDLY
ncbi:MAG: permease-like cell division protein FtsX [Paraprevotella sp.]|nr:permease-like cell division protein FtsX [Paraprevotella sp.]